MNTLKLTKCPDEATGRIIGVPHQPVGNIGPDRTGALQVLVVEGRGTQSPPWRDMLERCTAPSGVIAGEATDAVRAMELVQRHRFDLALVDVRLPGADGFVLARALAERGQPPWVVLVSDDPAHAALAFDADAVDFLPRPVRHERLQQALCRVRRRLEGSGHEGGAQTLLIPKRDQVLQVPLQEVVYFKAEMKYVTVRTARHRHLLAGSLADLQDRHGSQFLRVHRNALVALRCLRALERVPAGRAQQERWQLRLEEVDEVLAVSRRQLAAVRSAFRGGV